MGIDKFGTSRRSLENKRLEEVIKVEDLYLKERRKKIKYLEESRESIERIYRSGHNLVEEHKEKKEEDDVENLKETKIGIAFSGGGIRSASICLGVVNILSRLQVLQKADYISSVSGGGYTNAFVQALLNLKRQRRLRFKLNILNYILNYIPFASRGVGRFLQALLNLNSRNRDFIFNEANIYKCYQSLGDFSAENSSEKADYMSWGVSKIIPSNLLTLVNVLTSIIIGFINPVILVSTAILAWYMASHFSIDLIAPYKEDLKNISIYLGLLALGAWSFGTILYYFMRFRFLIKQWFNVLALYFFGIALIAVVLTYSEKWYAHLLPFLTDNMWFVFGLFCGIVILGFFTNINALSFGRIYGDSLAKGFLKHNNAIRLHDLAKEKDCLAPYPLFNCCLNTAPQERAGSFNKTADYFLLSPSFFGSSLTGYISMKRFGIRLSTAMTTSAAAINSGMGTFSSGLLNLLVGLFNFRMGSLLVNPKLFQLIDEAIEKRKKIKNRTKRFLMLITGVIPYLPSWWPLFHFKSLFSTNSLKDPMLDISDGGHIENLGVFELLRRRCTLIIGVDAGMDSKYEFEDLKNLIRRAKNELDIDFRWRKDNDPFEKIKPDADGFSEKRFVIADYVNVIGKPLGTFVYIKSSLKRPEGGKSTIGERSIEQLSFSGVDKDIVEEVYEYINYNYEFPHHATSDQSFDPIQFMAYLTLGKSLCAEVFKSELINLDKEEPFQRKRLISKFEE